MHQDVGEDDDTDYSEPYVLQLGVFISASVLPVSMRGISRTDARQTCAFLVPAELWRYRHGPLSVTESKLAGVLDIGVTLHRHANPSIRIVRRATLDGTAISLNSHTWFSVAPSINLSGIMLGVWASTSR